MKRLLILLPLALLSCTTSPLTVDAPEETPGLANSDALPAAKHCVTFSLETVGSPSASSWLGLHRENGGKAYAGLRRLDSEAELQALLPIPHSAVDWSARTMLVCYGMELYQNYPRSVDFQLDEQGNARVVVGRVKSFAAATLWWTWAVLVDKLPADAVITVETSFL